MPGRTLIQETLRYAIKHITGNANIQWCLGKTGVMSFAGNVGK